MYVLVFQRKTCLGLLNRFNFLKHVQHLDAHNYNEKNEEEKKKEKIFSLQLFRTHATLENILKINGHIVTNY